MGSAGPEDRVEGNKIRECKQKCFIKTITFQGHKKKKGPLDFIKEDEKNSVSVKVNLAFNNDKTTITCAFQMIA